MKNELFKFVKSDFVKALWIFIISTILSVIGDAVMQEVANGNYSIANIHWKEIGVTILVAVISYLQKQFLSNSDGQVLKKETEKLNG